MILMRDATKYYRGFQVSDAIEEACMRHGVQVLWLVPDESTVGLFAFDSVPVDAPQPAPPSETRASDLALVLHTSGTTKKPKIVPLTHHNLGHGIQFVAATLRRQPTDLNLNVMPLFHIHGLIANVGVSTYSCTPFIASSFRGGAHFCDQLCVADRAPTWYSAVPSMPVSYTHLTLPTILRV